jgi:hypothetical protein
MISQVMASSSEPAPNRKANPFQSSSQLSFSFCTDIGATNPFIMVSRAHLQNIQRLQMQGEQQARSLTMMQQPATLALSPHQLPMIQPPLNVDVNPILEQAVLAIQREYTPDSSNDIYDNKTTEYFQYCDYCYPFDNYNKVLDANRLYRFMLYQAFRNQKKRGGKRVTQNSIRFNLADYNEITQKYQTWMTGNSNAEPPEPKNPIQNSTMDQYKAVFRKVHKQQSAQRVTSSVWEQIWTLPIENLHKLVKQRRNCVRKATYAQKLEAEFVDKLDKLENELWDRGRGSHRSAGTWLRHRYCMLHTTSGILRCESIYHAELSDFLDLTLKKKEDPHPLTLMITQLPTGK